KTGPRNSALDRGLAKSAGRLRSQVIAHESVVNACNNCGCFDERGAFLAGGGDSLERLGYRGKRRAAAANSARTDAHRGITQEIFRLQSISGNRPFAKGPQNRSGRLACDK